jgi:hypothetical protein
MRDFPPRKKGRGQNIPETKTAEALDDLAEFEAFKRSLLPVLRADLKNGTPAKDILEKMKSLAAARLGHIIMSEIDSSKALSAIKDVLDRTEGKAKESITTTHKFESMKEAELDALLKSKMASVASDEAGDDEDPH